MLPATGGEESSTAGWYRHDNGYVVVLDQGRVGIESVGTGDHGVPRGTTGG